MNLARINKKTPHTDLRKTLHELHEQKLKEFEDERIALPDMTKKLTNLIILYESDSYQGDIFKLYKEIIDLQKEVLNITINKNETDYLSRAAGYILEYSEDVEDEDSEYDETDKKYIEDVSSNIDPFSPYAILGVYPSDSETDIKKAYRSLALKYHPDKNDEPDAIVEFKKINKAYEDILNEQSEQLELSIIKPHEQNELSIIKRQPALSNFVNQKKVSRKGEICKNYIDECISGHRRTGTHDINESLVCNKCDCMRIIIEKEAIATCENCGDVVSYQDPQRNQQYSDNIEILSPFAYKRINHFREWIAQIQARETSLPDQDVIDKLLLELKKDRIKDTSEITNKRIKNYLKKLRLNKYYEHIPAIIYKLSGIPPPVITKKLEEKLINMFEQIQIPFEKHCPPDRKNFMSYSYTLHKMCELLGEDELVECFDLLKSREKLYFQDKIWSGICTEMRWDFMPSL